MGGLFLSNGLAEAQRVAVGVSHVNSRLPMSGLQAAMYRRILLPIAILLSGLLQLIAQCNAANESPTDKVERLVLLSRSGN